MSARAIIGACCAVMLIGCGGSGDADVAFDESTAAKVERTIDRSPGKPAPPIDLRYTILGEPSVGEPLEITLNVATPLEGPMLLSLRPKDGLVLGANQLPSMDLGTAAAGSAPAENQRITVIPQAEGRSYVVVNVTVATADGPQTKVMSIPIQVGDVPPRLESNGRVTGDDADAVVSMPAADTNDEPQ